MWKGNLPGNKMEIIALFVSNFSFCFNKYTFQFIIYCKNPALSPNTSSIIQSNPDGYRINWIKHLLRLSNAIDHMVRLYK